MRSVLLLAISLVALLLVGCRQSSSPTATDKGYTLTLINDPNPPVVGLGTLTIALKDPQGNPVTDATLEIRGDMSHAGMIPSFAKPLVKTGSDYPFSMEWTMSGEWIITVNATLTDNTSLKQTFTLEVLMP